MSKDKDKDELQQPAITEFDEETGEWETVEGDSEEDQDASMDRFIDEIGKSE